MLTATQMRQIQQQRRAARDREINIRAAQGLAMILTFFTVIYAAMITVSYTH